LNTSNSWSLTADTELDVAGILTHDFLRDPVGGTNRVD
jgi:hypothetical protein